MTRSEPTGFGRLPGLPGLLPESSASTVAPSIDLLGAVTVNNPRGILDDAYRAGQLTRLAAWLVLHPGGTATAMEHDLWFGGNRINTRNTAVSRLRRWLGLAPDGRPYLPRQDRGYHLHPVVTSDWDYYKRLVGTGLNTAPTLDLVAALDLVRGAPFANATDYEWAEHTRLLMCSVIRDTAHVVASRAMRTGQLDLARQAVSQGYLADADDELLARAEMRLEAVASNQIGIQRVADRLLSRLKPQLQPETVALIRTLRPAAAVRPARRTATSCLHRSNLVLNRR